MRKTGVGRVGRHTDQRCFLVFARPLGTLEEGPRFDTLRRRLLLPHAELLAEPLAEEQRGLPCHRVAHHELITGR